MREKTRKSIEQKWFTTRDQARRSISYLRKQGIFYMVRLDEGKKVIQYTPDPLEECTLEMYLYMSILINAELQELEPLKERFPETFNAGLMLPYSGLVLTEIITAMHNLVSNFGLLYGDKRQVELYIQRVTAQAHHLLIKKKLIEPAQVIQDTVLPRQTKSTRGRKNKTAVDRFVMTSLGYDVFRILHRFYTQVIVEVDHRLEKLRTAAAGENNDE